VTLALFFRRGTFLLFYRNKKDTRSNGGVRRLKAKILDDLESKIYRAVLGPLERHPEILTYFFKVNYNRFNRLYDLLKSS